MSGRGRVGGRFCVFWRGGRGGFGLGWGWGAERSFCAVVVGGGVVDGCLEVVAI